jgi:hypothetical protein
MTSSIGNFNIINNNDFDVSKIRLVQNSIKTKDKETGRDLTVQQLLFDVVSDQVRENAKPKFILKSPIMQTKKPIQARESKNGDMDYSIFQLFDMANEEEKKFVDNCYAIKDYLAAELVKPEVKKFTGHKIPNANVAGSVPCLIYREMNDEGTDFKEGSKPSCFFNLFQARNTDGSTFGTDVVLMATGQKLSRPAWIKLLSTHTMKYQVCLRYMRLTISGTTKLALITQAHSVLIYDVFPIVSESMAVRMAKSYKAPDEEVTRAKEIEKMLSMDGIPEENSRATAKASKGIASVKEDIDLGLDVSNEPEW